MIKPQTDRTSSSMKMMSVNKKSTQKFASSHLKSPLCTECGVNSGVSFVKSEMISKLMNTFILLFALDGFDGVCAWEKNEFLNFGIVHYMDWMCIMMFQFVLYGMKCFRNTFISLYTLSSLRLHLCEWAWAREQD